MKTLPSVDFCVLGEGEEKLIFLLNKIQNGTCYDAPVGYAFFKDRLVHGSHERPKRMRMGNLGLVNWPAWHLFPLENYFRAGLGWAIRGKRSMPMLASRGCPYECSFCSNAQMWGRFWKARDVNELVAEMKYYIHTYNVSHFDFYDLTAIVDKNWIKDFCVRLIEEDLNVSWSLPAGTRSEALSEDVIIFLKKAGLFKLAFAPESGSTRILSMVKKRVDLERMLFSVRMSSKHNLISKANMVCAFPDETFEDIFWDFVILARFALAGLNDVSYFCFAPYPGSEFFQNLVARGVIQKDKNYDLFLANNVHNNIFKMRSYSRHIPSFAVPLIILVGTSFFYTIQFLIRPWRIISLFRRLLTGKPQTMLEMVIETIIVDLFGRRYFGGLKTTDEIVKKNTC